MPLPPVPGSAHLSGSPSACVSIPFNVVPPPAMLSGLRFLRRALQPDHASRRSAHSFSATSVRPGRWLWYSLLHRPHWTEVPTLPGWNSHTYFSIWLPWAQVLILPLIRTPLYVFFPLSGHCPPLRRLCTAPFAPSHFCLRPAKVRSAD